MGTLTSLTNADTLRFDVIDLELVGPPQARPGPRHDTGICVSKPAGALRFALNSYRDLKLSSPQIVFDFDDDSKSGVYPPVDIDIEFSAALPVTTLPDDSLIITWKVGQKVDRDFNFADYSLHIDRIDGSVTTLVRRRMPRGQGTTCAGASRTVPIDLEPAAGENKLTISGTAQSGVFSASSQITVENIAMTGHALEDYGISAGIGIPSDECGIGPGPGALIHVWASIYPPPTGPVTYAWSVTGAAAITGPTDQPTVQIKLDRSGQPFDVILTASADGVSATGRRRCIPETKDSVRMKRLLCDMRSLLHVNLFVDPLWDPLRDYVARPPTRAELRQLERFGRTLANQAKTLLGRGKTG